MKRGVVLAASLALIAGCGPSQQEFDELKQHAKALESELHELKFGAQSLLEQARTAFANDQDQEALTLLQSLLDKYPSSAEAAPAQVLLSEVQASIEAKVFAEAQALKQALSNMQEVTDEVRQITWVSHVQQPKYGSYASFYFGMQKGSAAEYPVRLVLKYVGADWLNAYKIIIRADDALFELNDIQTLNEAEMFSAMQKADVEITDKALLEALMTAERVLVRFEGPQYYGDFEIAKEQQTLMAEVYRAYQRMGGQF